MRDRTGQKNGGVGEVIKEKKHFHFFIEMILDYWISSKN